MAEIRLQGARVGALVGKLKAAGVPEHVRVGLEAKLGRDAQPRHQCWRDKLGDGYFCCPMDTLNSMAFVRRPATLRIHPNFSNRLCGARVAALPPCLMVLFRRF